MRGVCCHRRAGLGSLGLTTMGSVLGRSGLSPSMKPWGQGLQGREEGCRGGGTSDPMHGVFWNQGKRGLGEDLSAIRCHRGLSGRVHQPGSVEVTGILARAAESGRGFHSPWLCRSRLCGKYQSMPQS